MTLRVAKPGERLDRFVAKQTGSSRTEVQRWIDAGAVTIDGKPARASDVVRVGAMVEATPLGAAETDLTPDASVPFDVLFVDESIVVLVKPPGVVVHPAPGSPHGTLVHGLLARGLFAAASDAAKARAASERPGIVHRLDKGTSGVMVVARTPAAREALKAQFAEHTIDREYVAICAGLAKTQAHRTLHGRDPRNRLRFTSRVRSAVGKPARVAITHIERLESLAKGAASLVCATLETGRTHQIRMHLSEAGTPILGDPLYGKPCKDARVEAVASELGHQALHARLLGFVHPTTGVAVRFEAPPPKDFTRALERLRSL